MNDAVFGVFEKKKSPVFLKKVFCFGLAPDENRAKHGGSFDESKRKKTNAVLGVF